MAPNTGLGGHEADAPAGRGRVNTAWTDWILQRLQAAPWPLPATLLTGLAVAVLALHVLQWIVGGVETGAFTRYHLTTPVYPFGVLAAIGIQNHLARRALARFRPAMPGPDAEYEAIEYDLTHQPAGLAVIAGMALGVVGVVTLLSLPESSATREQHPIAFAIDVASNFVTYAFAGPWIVGAIRLLRRIDELHWRATRLDLFHREPLHAFSSVAAWVGVSLVAVVTFSMVTDTESTLETSAGLTLSGVIAVLAGASFFVPLWGMHSRLQTERARLAAEVSSRIELVLRRIYDGVDHDEERTGDHKDQLDALVSARALIAQLSTWPWRPETPRWLLSALVVPLALWGITRLLERATGL